MALQFIEKPKGSIIGVSTYVFQHYGTEIVYIAPPTVSGSYTYNGSTQSASISGYDANTMTQSGTTSAINAGSYTVSFTPKSGYAWTDGTTSAKSYNWSIAKMSLTIPTLSNTSKTYNGGSQAPTVNNYNSTYESQGGTASATNAGSYSVTWSLKSTSNTQWSDGTTAQKSGSWSIAKASSSISTSTNSISLSGAVDTSTSFTYSRVGDGTMSVYSNNTGLVTVSGSSSPVTVYLKGTGSTTIGLSQAAGTNYNASSKTISFTGSVYPYVKSGLLCHLDGIANNGWGNSHLSSLTTWVDCSGNGNNGIKTGNGSWSVGSNYVDTTSSSYVALPLSTLRGSGYTYEFVLQLITDPSIKTYAIMDTLDGYEPEHTSMLIYDTANERWMIESGEGSVWDPIYTIALPLSTTFALSMRETAAYLNNASRDTDITEGGLGGSATSLTLGYRAYRKYYYPVRIYSFRVYNRQLTDAERTQNYNADKARFGF